MLSAVSVHTPPPPVPDTYERFDFPEPDDAMFPPDTAAAAAATGDGHKQDDEEDEEEGREGREEGDEVREEQGEPEEERVQQELRAEDDDDIGNAVVRSVSLAPFFPADFIHAEL